MTSRSTRALVLASTVGVIAGAALVTTAASASATTPHQCGNGALAVTATFTQGGLGHSYFDLVYRNTTKSTCTVYGFPGLDAVNSHGKVLAHAQRSNSTGKPTTVTIKSGGYASASVEYLNFNPKTTGDCTFSAAIETIVANTTRAVRLPVSVSICELQVHPTVANIPNYPGFGPAQTAWIAGSHVDAANQNRYLRQAEQHLQAGRDYPTQVAELNQLISFPDTGLTAKQIKEAQADVRALDSFFVTPGLYN